MRWHFEGRHERNETPTVPPEQLDDSWVLLPEALSAYHQDPDEEVELKFVKRDENSFLKLGSHEAVWDPNQGVWLEAGAFGSTASTRPNPASAACSAASSTTAVRSPARR